MWNGGVLFPLPGDYPLKSVFVSSMYRCIDFCSRKQYPNARSFHLFIFSPIYFPIFLFYFFCLWCGSIIVWLFVVFAAVAVDHYWNAHNIIHYAICNLFSLSLLVVVVFRFSASHFALRDFCFQLNQLNYRVRFLSPTVPSIVLFEWQFSANSTRTLCMAGGHFIGQ